MMEHDKTTKDEIADGMASAGRQRTDKPGTGPQQSVRETSEHKSAIERAGAKASPKMPSSGSEAKPTG